MKKNPTKKGNIDFTPKYTKFNCQFDSVTTPSPRIWCRHCHRRPRNRVLFIRGEFSQLSSVFLDPKAYRQVRNGVKNRQPPICYRNASC